MLQTPKQTDIRDREAIYKIFEEEKPNIVVNFAAESHVDRSILDPESLIDHVPDRHGHDQRYAIDPTKANKELGWDSITTFEVGIKKIEWYLSEKGSTWLDECMKQNQEWLEKNYKNRK